MASTSETVRVTAECLCKAHTFSTEVPLSKLPLLASACHCTSCRHATGALYSIDVPWPGPRQEVDTSKLKSYPFSTNISILFCGTCSAPLFFESTKEPRELGVFTGALRNDDINVVNIVDHIFVGDTIDGGATMWLRNPNADGSEARRFKERNTGEPYPLDWPSNSTFTGYEKKTENESIPIICHCKGVNFLLHRGKYDGLKDEELPWFIDPKTHKSFASFDACDSCRLQSGIDVFNWTFAELANISFSTPLKEGGKAFPTTTQELKTLVGMQDEAIGTLSYYQSSSDVQRYFCNVCSANVFYAVDDRTETVDVAIGVLDAPDGARAEGFLSWDFGGPFSWVEDTKGGWREGFVERVKHEAEAWRIERGYPKTWVRIKKEGKE
jgi:hypothetical protein